MAGEQEGVALAAHTQLLQNHSVNAKDSLSLKPVFRLQAIKCEQWVGNSFQEPSRSRTQIQAHDGAP